jgi:hypothetical protein
MAKATNLPYTKGSRSTVSRPLERVWFDVIGPVPVLGQGGFKYILTLVDEHTGMYFVFPIRKKSDVETMIQGFVTEQERHWKSKFGDAALSPQLVKFCSDGGGENIKNTLALWLNEMGIKHDVGVPYDHSQLGKVERANRTLYEGSEAMRIFAGFPPSYWPYTVRAFCYLKNLVPNHMTKQVAEHDLSPFERWHQHQSSNFAVAIKHLRVIGCTAYVFIPKVRRLRGDKKCVKGILVGYSDEQKAYLILVGKVVVKARSVYFNETEFQMKSGADKQGEDFFE